MFSTKQKREIADGVQKILRATNHPELPLGEIKFLLHVDGAELWSWADILNNGAVTACKSFEWNKSDGLCLDCGEPRSEHVSLQSPEIDPRNPKGT